MNCYTHKPFASPVLAHAPVVRKTASHQAVFCRNRKPRPPRLRSPCDKTGTLYGRKRAGSHAAGPKKNRRAKDGQPVFSTCKGVRVGIVKTDGGIMTVFPDINQPGERKRGE